MSAVEQALLLLLAVGIAHQWHRVALAWARQVFASGAGAVSHTGLFKA